MYHENRGDLTNQPQVLQDKRFTHIYEGFGKGQVQAITKLYLEFPKLILICFLISENTN